MAYNKRPGNLFHNIKGSQSSQAPTQPGIGGMGEVESPAPYIVPVVRGALAVAGRTALGQTIKQGGKRIIASGASRLKGILGKGKPSIPTYATDTSGLVAKKSFGRKAFDFASNIGVGVGLGSFFGSDSSPEDTKGASGDTSTNGGSKKKPGSYVKPGGKATGNMKDYALNSQARRDEYTARGWKQDATTSVKGGNKVVSELKSNPVVQNKPEIKSNVTITPPATSAVDTQKDKNKIDRKNRSIDKKQAKIDAATESGNDKKAKRKQRSLDNKKARLSDKGLLDKQYMTNLSGGGGGLTQDPPEETTAPAKALSDLKANLGTGKNQIDPESKFGKKVASALPYTSRIQASAQYRKPNAAGQYDK